MRRLLTIVASLFPLALVGQSLLVADPQHPQALWQLQNGHADAVSSIWPATKWRLDRAGISPVQGLASAGPWAEPSVMTMSGEQNRFFYRLSPQWQPQATVIQPAWQQIAVPVTASPLGADWLRESSSLGFSIGAASLSGQAAHLPRLIPEAVLGMPYPALTGSNEFNAVGRWMLNRDNRAPVGASIGRVDLFPANSAAASGLDQKTLSIGIQHGALSGLWGDRSVEALKVSSLGHAYGLDHRWSRLGFGVTWRLPWQGQISFGAHNLWSSGLPAAPPVGPATVIQDTSRTPYVQYHQDL